MKLFLVLIVTVIFSLTSAGLVPDLLNSRKIALEEKVVPVDINVVDPLHIAQATVFASPFGWVVQGTNGLIPVTYFPDRNYWIPNVLLLRNGLDTLPEPRLYAV